MMDDVNAVCDVLPDVELKYFVETDGDTDIQQGDLANVTIRLERIDRREKTKSERRPKKKED
eukprot:TRINITY_DN6955_c0_g1_i1.p1 TRINITY_DN6955_c0_g1~~TRINITY_DN6955_c0_g1_i1.p1  ORF type:complete len:62 (-),score=22.52 TRINITY_DN6955_c0_g1_i1:54-239(-)